MASELWVIRSGTVPYAYAREAQRALEAARQRSRVPDLLLLLEHPPVYTKGRRAGPEELPMGEHWYRMQGIDVCETDRGGRVTYHGPGQLVGYPIISLRELERRDDVHAYVRALEGAMIAALGTWDVAAQTISGLTGVWTAGPRPDDAEALAAGRRTARKIGSIGVHVSRGVSTHGLAINVNNDLQPFEWIVPCGIEFCRMSSLAAELGAEQDLHEFGTAVADELGQALGRVPVPTAAAHLAELVDGVGALVGDVPAPVR